MIASVDDRLLVVPEAAYVLIRREIERRLRAHVLFGIPVILDESMPRDEVRICHT